MPINNYGAYMPRFGTNNYYSPTLPSYDMNILQPQTPQFQQTSNQQQPQTNISWISGGEPALGAIQTPPNSMFCFFDNNDNLMYFKTVDGNGKPSIKTYKYVEYNPSAEQAETPAINVDNYVTKDELTGLTENLNKQITDLRKALNDFKSKIGNANKNVNKEVKSNAKSSV